MRTQTAVALVAFVVSTALTACTSPANIDPDQPITRVLRDPVPALNRTTFASDSSLRGVLASGGVVTVMMTDLGCFGLGTASYVLAWDADDLVVLRNGLKYVLRGTRAADLLDGLDAAGPRFGSPLDGRVDVEITWAGVVSSVTSHGGTGRGVAIADALRTVAGV